MRRLLIYILSLAILGSIESQEVLHHDTVDPTLGCGGPCPVKERNTLWFDGAYSAGWEDMKKDLRNEGYYFKDLVNSGQRDIIVPIDLYYLPDHIAGHDLVVENRNILGVAHCSHGLALRKAQLLNDNITAMILNGVPNHGSGLIQSSVQSLGWRSRLEEIFDYFGDLRNGNADCENYGCDFAEELRSFFLNEANENAWSASTKAQLLHDLTPPTVPYAVFYSTVEEMNFIDLLDRHKGSSTYFSKSCYEEKIESAAILAKDKLDQELISISKGLTGGLINGIIAAADSQGEGTFDLSIVWDRTIGAIYEREDYFNHFVDIMSCLLFDQLLEIQIQLEVLLQAQEENDIKIAQEVIGLEPAELHLYCLNECDEYYDPYDDRDFERCYKTCSENNRVSKKITVLTPLERSDGIYLESEQRLEGAVAEFHLEETYHGEGQDPDADSGRNIEHMRELFDGQFGPAFKVDKK